MHKFYRNLPFSHITHLKYIVKEYSICLGIIGLVLEGERKAQFLSILCRRNLKIKSHNLKMFFNEWTTNVNTTSLINVL